MRLNVALIACSLATSAFADPQPREPARAHSATAARAPDPAPPLGMVVAHQMRARADSLRRQGDYEAALDAYQSEMAVEGETADCWKHIGWTQRALRRYADAEASLRRASELDPNDREAQDDLDGLHLSRGLRLDARMGGSEPGTSKNAFEGELTYGGFNRVELHAGGSWTDNIFYDAIKGYANAYWFYSPDSYLKADFTLRRYNYTGANRPTPDSSAYDTVPRGSLEVSHWFAQRIRGGLEYQLFAPDFFYDHSKRILNHKVTGELEARLGGGFTAAITAALLRDPDPATTLIAGRPVPGAPPGTVCPAAGQPNCATATNVKFRSEFLLGGSLSYQADLWGIGVKYIPNRDLDSGFDWSIISSLDLRPLEKLSFNFQWVLDRYSNSSGPLFAGQNGNIWWATVRYQLTRPLALGAGVKWVANPSPADVNTTSTRNDPTFLLNIDYRTVLF
ncbi:MAG TPA: tetratricopeptide repeat protein [Myxococcales bacterium]|jgi:tetratricopeptide (TPR) repeat protein|nr:tetratricopeptide repeat protein [Myxococcales bacterium]